MSRTRLAGAALFAFIPLVLILYLRMPLGTGPSVLCGLAIMLGHRPIARPFMERHLDRRCFWCGRDLRDAGLPAPFRSGRATIAARACTPPHAERLAAFGRAVAAAKVPLLVLIVAPVVLYLANALLAAAGRAWIPMDAARLLFKLPIAAAVVSLSVAWPLGRRLAREPAIDLPAHNLSLLGVSWTLWIFRLVGAYWLVEPVLRR
ncbi:MAG TPA: hypothetical protein VFB67_11695 [Candidatus Polarisedimenticolaceae bacterium]|nr:hypothetical protein [Candidatus Polarisedimenticolaceae bacterium]